MTTTEEMIRPNPNRTLFIGFGIVAGAIILIFIVVAIVFVLLDPFNIVAWLTGRYDPIASALPPDSPFILSVDFAKLQTKENKRIIDAFMDTVEAADIEDITTQLFWVSVAVRAYWRSARIRTSSLNYLVGKKHCWTMKGTTNPGSLYCIHKFEILATM